jgi:hypothetical protein
MKEFLDTLYKACVAPNDDSMGLIFDVLPKLGGQRKFDVMNQLLVDIDISRLDTSAMYGIVHCISHYINQLPQYRTFYQNVREEFARRGEPSARIKDLFDRYENGWRGDLYDPNKPPYKSPDEKFEETLEAKIAWAQEIGDKDLVDMLTYYRSYRLGSQERDRKFQKMRMDMGDEELRKRTVESLREVADKLDKSAGSWPGIYYCDLPEDPLMKNTFIDGITVVISYPWPG